MKHVLDWRCIFICIAEGLDFFVFDVTAVVPKFELTTEIFACLSALSGDFEIIKSYHLSSAFLLRRFFPFILKKNL